MGITKFFAQLEAERNALRRLATIHPSSPTWEHDTARIRAMQRAYRKGLSPREIGTLLGISASTVAQVVGAREWVDT